MWELSDFELVKLDPQQFQRVDLLLATIGNALWAINDQLKPLDNAIDHDTTETTKWLAIIAEAIGNTAPQPQPKPQGVLTMKFTVPADNPDVEFDLIGSGFTDSEGNATTAEDIDLTAESSNPSSLASEVLSQTLSDDKASVSAHIKLHFGGPSSDVANLALRATNRDTGNVVAAATHEFVVVVGEAGLGTLTAEIPLTPDPEP